MKEEKLNEYIAIHTIAMIVKNIIDKEKEVNNGVCSNSNQKR